MKCKFEKIDGRWVVRTGERVVVDKVQTNFDDFADICAPEVIDICTGKRFGVIWNKNYKLAEIIDYPNDITMVSHRSKKAARRARIYDMCGIHWDKYDMKKIGKNRFLRRRMYPNAKQMADFDDYLPF